MRNRMIGCALILLGTLSVAAGGSLTRLGHYEYLYIAMSIGIALIFLGVLQTRRPDRTVASSVPSQSGNTHQDEIPPVPAALEPEPYPVNAEPALAFVEHLLRQGTDDVARICAEWSVPANEDNVLSRGDARSAWAFRLVLPEESQRRFDALPVPARRQVTTLYTEVLTWQNGRPVPAPEPSALQERTLRIEQKMASH